MCISFGAFAFTAVEVIRCTICGGEAGEEARFSLKLRARLVFKCDCKSFAGCAGLQLEGAYASLTE